MRLIELNPVLKKNRLELDCPKCKPVHRIVIRFGSGAWQLHCSDFDKFTFTPSWHSQVPKCKAHFTINNGIVTMDPNQEKEVKK